MATAAATSPPEQRPLWHLFIPLLAGLVVAETLGIVARQLVVEPGAYPGPWFRLFFSDTLHLKAWLALAAAALGVTQLLTAAWIFRKLPWPRPRYVNVVHRWAGRLAFLATIPVAYHCVFKLGFQTYDTRVAVHSFFGVAFFGAFATKVLIVRMHRFPAWALPIAGGAALRRADRRLVDELVLVPARGRRRRRRLACVDFELTDEQRLIQDTVRAFVDERVLPVAIQNDIDHKLDLELIEGMAELGILGIVIPEEYGGAGLDYVVRGARLRGDRARRGRVPDADLRPRRAELARRSSATAPRSRSSATSSRRRRARSSPASG